MSALHQAFVALGANLGDPKTTVQAALGRLAELPESRLIKASALYLTAPLSLTNQPDFINAVALLETTLEPEALLTALFALEAEFGRVRLDRNGPRTLDLDLLLFDDLVLESLNLTLPHPRLHQRAFVLAPLAEIAPTLIIPKHGKLTDLLLAVADQPVSRLP